MKGSWRGAEGRRGNQEGERGDKKKRNKGLAHVEINILDWCDGQLLEFIIIAALTTMT